MKDSFENKEGGKYECCGGIMTVLISIVIFRKDKLDPTSILESFEQAIEHYGKFG